MITSFVIISIILTGISKKTIKEIKYSDVPNFLYEAVLEHATDAETLELKSGDYHSFQEFSNLESLIECSDYVLLVEALNIEDVYFSEILRNVKIIKIIKSSGEIYDKNIGILEPIMLDGNSSLASIGNGYIPMKEGNTYYVFLENVIGYRREGVYKYVSLEYGKFYANGESSNIININRDSETSLTLSEISDYDFANIYQPGETLKVTWKDVTGEITENTIDISSICNTYTQIKLELNDKMAE